MEALCILMFICITLSLMGVCLDLAILFCIMGYKRAWLYKKE